jgi:hypothetical protein
MQNSFHRQLLLGERNGYIRFDAKQTLPKLNSSRVVCGVRFYGGHKEQLPSDAWGVVRKEIPWATIGVIGISDCGSGNTGAYARILTILTVGKVRPVVAASSLPTYFARTAAKWAIATVALAMIMMQVAAA